MKKKCQICGNECPGKWIYCSNECILEGMKHSTNEGRLLKKLKDNYDLYWELYLAELQLELLPPDQYFLVKSEFVSPDEKVKLEQLAIRLADEARLQD